MGANKTRTGWMREIEKQYPGSWEVVGSFGDRARVLSAGRIGVGGGAGLTPQTEDQHPGSSCCPCCHPASFPGSWLCLPLAAVATTLGGACTLSPAPISPVLSRHREC